MSKPKTTSTMLRVVSSCPHCGAPIYGPSAVDWKELDARRRLAEPNVAIAVEYTCMCRLNTLQIGGVATETGCIPPYVQPLPTPIFGAVGGTVQAPPGPLPSRTAGPGWVKGAGGFGIVGSGS